MKKTYDGGLELGESIRIMRALEPKYQTMVVGICGSSMWLKVEDEETYLRWVRAWSALQ